MLATIVVVEKQSVLLIMCVCARVCVCVCVFVALGIQHAMRMRHIFICCLSGCTLMSTKIHRPEIF